MDSSRSLAQVIFEMQNEIKKLELENKTLRGELHCTPSPSEHAEQNALAPEIQQRDESLDSLAHASLRRNVSAPALEGQYKENIIMTVRRYSISSNTLNASRKRENLSKPQRDSEASAESNSKWARLHDSVHGRPSSTFSNQVTEDHNSVKERLSNRRSLQEYVNKNRAKVKTVTFLLPVDDIYTNRPVLGSCLPDRSSSLNVIAEKDS